MPVSHTFVSAKSDDPDTSLVNPSNWNEDHSFTVAGIAIFNETPTGLINGVNAVFTLASTPSPAGSLILVRGGLIQREGVDFNLVGNTITFTAGNIPQTGEFLRALIYFISG